METTFVPYDAQHMLDLVMDIESYPEFLPWCSAARITQQSEPKTDNSVELNADIIISFKLFRESYSSKIQCQPEKRIIIITSDTGPFKQLNSKWEFTPAEHGCLAQFSIQFEFRSKILENIVGIVFYQAMKSVVRALYINK